MEAGTTRPNQLDPYTLWLCSRDWLTPLLASWFWGWSDPDTGTSPEPYSALRRRVAQWPPEDPEDADRLCVVLCTLFARYGGSAASVLPGGYRDTQGPHRALSGQPVANGGDI